MLYVICYDIGDARRLGRVAKKMEGHGQRVQKSIFECHLDATDLETLLEEMRAIMDGDKDRVHCFTICDRDAKKILIDGRGEISRDWDYHIV